MDGTDGMKDDLAYTNALPVGLVMGMAVNKLATESYVAMSEYEKEKIIARSRNVKSKKEMEELIQRLGDGTWNSIDYE